MTSGCVAPTFVAPQPVNMSINKFPSTSSIVEPCLRRTAIGIVSRAPDQAPPGLPLLELPRSRTRQGRDEPRNFPVGLGLGEIGMAAVVGHQRARPRRRARL